MLVFLASGAPFTTRRCILMNTVHMTVFVRVRDVLIHCGCVEITVLPNFIYCEL